MATRLLLRSMRKRVQESVATFLPRERPKQTIMINSPQDIDVTVALERTSMLITFSKGSPEATLALEKRSFTGLVLTSLVVTASIGAAVKLFNATDKVARSPSTFHLNFSCQVRMKREFWSMTLCNFSRASKLLPIGGQRADI